MRLRLSVLLLLLSCAVHYATGRGLEPSVIQQRLMTIERTVPLPYHSSLVNDIKKFSSKQLPASFSEYESLIKKELLQHELPEELVYLPIAMTNMKFDYRHDNRAGVWALPELVALRYGLTVDETHDERFSVEASTPAVLSYLRDLYETYDDWWQCILAYANSPAAITRSHLQHPEADPFDPWSYYEKQQLPNISIIGDFIASYYVYSSDDKSVTHSTEQYAYCNFDRPIALSTLSSTIGLSEKAIRNLNPIFLTDQLLPFNGHPLRLPLAYAQVFENNRADLYDRTERLNEEKTNKARMEAEQKAKEQAKTKKELSYITYTVKPGDTLGKIAQRYHVKISDIKKWNKLKGDMIRDKQKLKIYQ